MDYGAQNQQQQQQTTQPAAPVTPADPNAAATTTPAAPVTPAAAADDNITLDDLFPSATPTTPVTPAAPTTPAVAAPATPTTPATPDEANKTKVELQQQLQESEQRLKQTIGDTVQSFEQKITRNNELATFFQNTDNEPFRKYSEAITKVATDPRFVGLKLDRAVGLALGPQVMMKIGAEIAQKAGTRAASNSTGGNQNAQRVFNNNGMPDYSKMTDQEFVARREAVIRGTRTN